MASYLKPKILDTDNGGEFWNKMMENYLKENNIDHITGGLYNPQHQGAVEAFNKTIRDFFISAKDHQGRIFCLVHYINDLLIYYNDRRHTTTQMRPFKLMTNLNNKNML